MSDEIRIKTKRVSIPAPKQAALKATLGPGSVIDGRYRLSQALSREADSVLFLGTHLHLGRTVEIKLLLEGEAKSQRRFFREGRILSLLRHPCIVGVHDMGVCEAGPYIVLEHLDGPHLGQMMAERGPLTLHRFRELAGQLLSGLECAHERGVVHRGLNPSAIIVARFGQGVESLKLTGFGASGRLSEDSSSITKSSPVIETATHFAPEQLLEREGADARTDIYAAGVLFYRMLTGTAPFVSKTVAGIIGKILGEPPRPPSAHRPELSCELDAIVLSCMAKQADARFQSIAELQGALEEALDDISSPDRDTIPPSI